MKQLRRSIIFLIISHLVLPAYSSQKHPGEDQQDPRSSKRARHAQKAPTQAELDQQLLSAVENDNISKVDSLIQSGADIDITDTGGSRNSLLHIAAFENHSDVINFLVKAGANIEALNHYNETPLHRAVRGASYYPLKPFDASHNAIKTLIDLGANTKATDYKGRTPLFHIIAETEDQDNGGDSSTYENISHTADIIKFLIEYGVDLMDRDPEYIKDTLIERVIALLLWANTNEDKEKLLQLRNDIFNRYEHNSKLITDDYGNTIFHHLFNRTELNSPVVIAFLRKYGRHIASNTKNMGGLTPLHVAAKKLNLVRLLVGRYGADPCATTPWGDTVTSLAGRWTNLTPQPDWTPLMRAVHHITSSDATALQTVQNALDHCDNPEFITAQHHSALSVAQCPEVKTVIRKHILTTRRQKISEYLQTNHNQPAVLANLQLQFVGTYEPRV